MHVIQSISEDSIYHAKAEHLLGAEVEIIELHPAVLKGGWRAGTFFVRSGELSGSIIHIVGIKLKEIRHES